MQLPARFAAGDVGKYKIVERWAKFRSVLGNFTARWPARGNGFEARNAGDRRKIFRRRQQATRNSSYRKPAGWKLFFVPIPTSAMAATQITAWLQELPKPITRLTWENTIQMSPVTALQLGRTNGDYVRHDLNGHYLQGPVWILPGPRRQFADCPPGLRTHARRAHGHRSGIHAYLVQASWAPCIASGAQITKLGSGIHSRPRNTIARSTPAKTRRS